VGVAEGVGVGFAQAQVGVGEADGVFVRVGLGVWVWVGVIAAAVGVSVAGRDGDSGAELNLFPQPPVPSQRPRAAKRIRVPKIRLMAPGSGRFFSFAVINANFVPRACQA